MLEMPLRLVVAMYRTMAQSRDADVAGMHGRPLADAEVLPAILAAVGHGLVVDLGVAFSTAIWAVDAVGPSLLLEPFLSGFIGGEDFE